MWAGPTSKLDTNMVYKHCLLRLLTPKFGQILLLGNVYTRSLALLIRLGSIGSPVQQERERFTVVESNVLSAL
jgi:hypothetical protein